MIRCLTLLILLISCYSCTVEKRLYNKGWHISMNQRWKHDQPDSPGRKKNLAEIPKEKAAISTFEEQFVTSIEDTTVAESYASSDQLIRPEVIAESSALLEIEPAPAAVDDTIVVDEETYKKYQNAEHHWSRKTKTIATSVIGFLAVGVVVLLIILAVSGGTSLGVIDFLAVLLLLLGLMFLFLIILIVMLSIPTSESLLAKLEKERVRKQKRDDELKDLPEEEREQAIAEDEEALRAKKKKRAAVLFIIAAVAAGLIVLVNI